MDKQLKEQWVAALRSGKYEQGTETLKDGINHYCCLGVLCEISPDITWGDYDGRGHGAWYTSGEPSDINIPSAYLDEIEMQQSQQEHLIEMNDTNRADFNAIADWIEENL